MEHKTLLDMLSEANEIVKRLSFDDVNKLIESGNTLIIDVREESEVLAGRIKNSIHIPRGLIEFSFELGSPNNPGNANADTNLVFYCAGGYRSVIAISILRKKGYSGMINITEGFNEILKSDLNENCYNSPSEASCNNI